jgi:Outer membrane protein beta-barrel domain
MTRRTWGAGLLVAATLCGTPSVASADQLFGFVLGGFFPYGFDSRTGGDVLVENLLPPVDPFVYDIGDFKGFWVGGEYLVGFGDWIEAGVGVSGYTKTVESFYRDSVHPDRTDILQDIKMSIVPVTASVRVFPTGRTTPVQAYLGAGLNFYRWKYSESGEFIDYSDESIFPLPTFRDTFEDDGTAIGPVFLAGARAPVGDNFMIGGEFRWQGGSGDLDPVHNFTGDKLDLGGYSVGATFHFRF